MIDGVKAVFRITESQALHLITRFDLEHSPFPNSTETNFKFSGKLRNLFIEIRFKDNGYELTIRGSLFKYRNNFNPHYFTWDELEEVVKDVFKNFYLDIFSINQQGKTKPMKQFIFPLCRVEVMVDIEIGIDDLPGFLDINLIQHKKVPFVKDDNLVHVCKHENYHIKIYPKAENILRVELVFLTNELRKYRIEVLSDLTKNKIKPLAERIKSEVAEIIFSDGVNIYTKEGLTKKEELKLLRYTSHWRNKQFLLDNAKGSKRDRKNASQRMWRLGIETKKILETKGSGYKKEIVELVNEKVDSFFS